MNIIRRCTVLSSVSLLAMSIGSSSYAYDAAADEMLFEEIVVTASLRKQNLVDVPAAMAVLDTEGLVKGGQTSMQDWLAYAPGVLVVNNGTPQSNSISIRGIAAIGTAGVGMYVDNVPWGSATPYAGGGSVALDAAFMDLERVEVIHGPQGTLYGASAMAGILKYVTTTPSTEQWNGSVGVNIAKIKEGGWDKIYKAKVNGPLVEDKVGIAINGFYQDGAGFVDDQVLNVTDVDSFEHYGGNFNLLFTPSDDLSIKLKAMYLTANYEGSSLIPVDNTTVLPLLGTYIKGDPAPNPTDYWTALSAATIEYDTGWADLISVTSYQKRAATGVSDVTRFVGGLVDQLSGSAPGTSTATFTSHFESKRFTQEVRLASKNNDTFEWLVGVYYTDEKGENNQDLATNPVVPPLQNVQLPSSYKEIAGFGNATYYLSSNFDLTAGIRISKNDVTFEQIGVGLLVGSNPESTDSDTVDTYLFTARYRPSENTAFYARVASGYRPSGANAVAIDPVTGLPTAPPSFLADQLWSYELGMKGNLMDNVIRYDLAAFSIGWTDYQVGIVRNGQGVTGNADSARSRGFEASVQVTPGNGLTVTGALAYSDGEITSDEPDLGGLNGDRFPNHAPWTASFGARYDFTINDTMNGFINGNARYRSSRNTGYSGVSPFAVPNLQLDNYTVVGLSAGIVTERFDINLYATNLFNSSGIQTIQASFAGSMANFVRPRTIGISATARF